MLSFRLLRDVQSHIDKRRINSREMGEIAQTGVKSENTECDAETENSFASGVDFAVPAPFYTKPDEPENRDEKSGPKAFINLRRTKKNGALSNIASNSSFCKVKDSMGAEVDECEKTPVSSVVMPCKRSDNGIMSGYAGSMADVRRDLSARLAEKDESFADYLIARIDEAGITDADCYTKAQVSRQLFNKIKNTKDYRPSKATAIALGFALNLAPNAFNDLLSKAGYTLSNNNDFDLIVDYCIVNNIHDIDDINELLFFFDQPLLGSK